MVADVVCDCGHPHVTRAYYLTSGHTKSCGCLQDGIRRSGPTQRIRIEAGARYGRWTVVVSRAPEGGGPTVADVKCDCGSVGTVIAQNLKRGLSMSCGCLLRDMAKAAAVNGEWGSVQRTHGLSRTPEHISWLAAKGRCFNPLNPAFADYGGRGITMCAEWRDSFQAFLRDMGPCPVGYEIDRIDNDKGYEPGNCRWATPVQQSNNRRSNHVIEAFGKRLSLAEWARSTGLGYDLIKQRINKLGWVPERALSTPSRRVA